AGGLRPRVRRRATRHLTLAEREEISRGVAVGDGVRTLARRLGRAPSTISRELERRGGAAGYRAAAADAEAWTAGRRPKRTKLARLPRLRRVVERQLRADWSPQQIAAWLQETYPDDLTMQVSHETIYQALYVQARGALKRQLVAHLRRGQHYRRPRAAAQRGCARRAGTLGRRPASRETRDADRHAGRTAIALCPLAAATGGGLRHGGDCARAARAAVAGRAAPIADVGPGEGDGAAPALHGRDGRAGVLLRSAESLAARVEREHERPAAAVLSQGHGSE